MSTVLNPYVSFRGQAREALDFYASVLGGEPRVMTFGEFGAPGVDPSWVMHGQLDTPSGFTLMCSDTPEQMELTQGNTITISLSGTDEVLREWFAGLAEGGTVVTPLEKQMWGDEFGNLVDRFGVAWLVDLHASA